MLCLCSPLSSPKGKCFKIFSYFGFFLSLCHVYCDIMYCNRSYIDNPHIIIYVFMIHVISYLSSVSIESHSSYNNIQCVHGPCYFVSFLTLYHVYCVIILHIIIYNVFMVHGISYLSSVSITCIVL